MSGVDNRLRDRLADQLVDGEAGVDAGWAPLVARWRDSDAGAALVRFVDARMAAGVVVYPARPLRALRWTPRAQVRVVVLGQDPYHGAGQSEGLAFSVPDGVAMPPSLRNVLAEWRRDLQQPMPAGGHLGAWARAGVLLLNAVLTVEDGKPASHAGRGWEVLTDDVIADVARGDEPVVFMLWGTHAQAKRPLIDAGSGRHLVLQCNHPSPLSARRGPAPFVGCGHFARAAAFLGACGRHVDWSLPAA